MNSNRLDHLAFHSRAQLCGPNPTAASKKRSACSLPNGHGSSETRPYRAAGALPDRTAGASAKTTAATPLRRDSSLPSVPMTRLTAVPEIITEASLCHALPSVCFEKLNMCVCLI